MSLSAKVDEWANKIIGPNPSTGVVRPSIFGNPYSIGPEAVVSPSILDAINSQMSGVGSLDTPGRMKAHWPKPTIVRTEFDPNRNAMVYTLSDGRIISIDEKAARATGYNVKELLDAMRPVSHEDMLRTRLGALATKFQFLTAMPGDGTANIVVLGLLNGEPFTYSESDDLFPSDTLLSTVRLAVKAS